MAKKPATFEKPFVNKVVGLGEVDPEQLLANPENFRLHPDFQQQALAGSVDEIGYIDPVIVNKRTETVIDGHLRVTLALRSGVKSIPVTYVDLTEGEERLALLSLDPIASMAASDREKLEELLKSVQSDDERVQAMLKEIAEREKIEYEEQPSEGSGAQIDKSDIPDSIWPSDNEWGIPLLDINLQAISLDLPFVAWGTIARSSRIKGTWHFYVEDYRFSHLWDDPSDIVNSKCVNIVEPNFSVYDQMPAAVALWAIYRKRWIARWAQSLGIKIFVDLNVAEPFRELNLLGVPLGWKAWATRGYSERVKATEREYEAACERASTDSILFAVYGGGKRVKEMCQSNGWLWFPEQEDAKNG